MDPRLAILFVVLSGHTVGFLLEERLNRRNLAVLAAAGAEVDGARLMYALYATYFLSLPFMLVSMLLPGHVLPAATLQATGFAAIALAQALRRWAMFSLGNRWSLALVRLAGLRPLNVGPYRLLKSPDYLSRIIEIFGFSMVTGRWQIGGVAATLLGVMSWRAQSREAVNWNAGSLAWDGAIK